MSNETVGIGVIGCGGMGRAVVHQVLKQDDRLRVAAIFDPDERSVEATLKMELMREAPVVCERYEDVVTRDDVDWVMIASWNCDHADQTEAAIKATIKMLNKIEDIYQNQL